MRQDIRLFDYNVDASTYIANLAACAREREMVAPSYETIKGRRWKRYVDSVVEDGRQVGQPGYLTYNEEEGIYE